MTTTVEQLCDSIAGQRLLDPTEMARLRERWFRPGRAGKDDSELFAQWLSENGYLSSYVVRRLRAGKGDLLRLNQYRLTDHLRTGPHAGAYLAQDPLGRRVVVRVFDPLRAARPEALRAFQDSAERVLGVQHASVSRTLDLGQAHGLHYLVSEYDAGETLADVLKRKTRLDPLQSARLMVLALAGLHALHERQVPPGPLSPESLLLTTVRLPGGGKARTLKILHAGIPPTWFDPDALEGAHKGSLAGIDLSPPEPAVAGDDLARLGATFYHCLTGQSPGKGGQSRLSVLPAEVPETLADIVEQMLDGDSSQRSRSAAGLGKRLRVFLASLEEERAEELLPAAPAAAPVEEPEPDPEPERQAPQRAPEGVQGKLAALWEEVRPSEREWVFLAAGAAGVVVLVLLLVLLTGIGFFNVVCLLTGGAISFFVERLLRSREEPAG